MDGWPNRRKKAAFSHFSGDLSGNLVPRVSLLCHPWGDREERPWERGCLRRRVDGKLTGSTMRVAKVYIFGPFYGGHGLKSESQWGRGEGLSRDKLKVAMENGE